MQPLKPLPAWTGAILTAVSGAVGYGVFLWLSGLLSLGTEPDGIQDVWGSGMARQVPFALLIHESWILFQHGNVLGNPFCQHLDRGYGVSMLRKGQHWVIAGVLVMYWSREVASMLLCLPYVTAKTQAMVLASSVYHTVKMLQICQDANRKWSPTLGIMRLLIDHWHFDSAAQVLISTLRFLLQGGDTLVHARIANDLLRGSGAGADGALRCVHGLFVLWAAHAALNQVTKMSTATLIVEAWKQGLGYAKPREDAEPSCKTAQPLAHGDGKCAVCDLLRRCAREGPKEAERGQRRGQDSARAIAAMFTVLIGSVAYAFVLYFVDALRCGWPGRHPELSCQLALLLHEAWVMLQHGNVLVNPFCQHLDRRYGVSLLQRGQHWVIAGVLVMYWAREVASMLLCMPYVEAPTQMAIIVSSAYHTVKMHSICYDAQRQWSPTLGIMRLLIDHWHLDTLGQRLVSLLRVVLQGGDTLTHVLILGDMLRRPEEDLPAKLWCVHALFAVWAAHAALNQLTGRSTATLAVEACRAATVGKPPSASAAGADCCAGTPAPACARGRCAVCSLLDGGQEATDGGPPDVVFLGHPAFPSDFFSLWADVRDTWQPRWWMRILGPVVSPLVPLLWPLFAGRPFAVVEDVRYDGVRMQNWVMDYFGYQYLLWPFRRFVAESIVANARRAEKAGVRVFTLGALNKAEFMNQGGLGLLPKLEGAMRVVHGNTLTAATIVEAVLATVGREAAAPVFCTGASSKVGTAVVLRLLQCGVRVVAHSSSPERLQVLEAQAESLRIAGKSCALLTTTRSLLDGVHVRVWIVGKNDARVARIIPHGGAAIVFSVPDPVTVAGRRDVRVVRGGILRLDEGRLSVRRQYANLLAADELYACHAAGIVAASRPAEAALGDELGEVRLEEMEPQLLAAKAMGFRLPEAMGALALPEGDGEGPALEGSARVLVLGAGPAGLAAAAALRQRGVRGVVLLERHGSVQGSWREHFTGLSINTRRDFCGLPGWPVPAEDFPEELGVEDYVRYLRAYAARFALDVRCGLEVVGVERDGRDWAVSARRTGTEGKEVLAWRCSELLVATGKSAYPAMPGELQALASEGAPVHHSSELRGDLLERAQKAAKAGSLLLVGLGNSAADLAVPLLGSPGSRLHVSLRRVPHIVRRQWGPLRLEWFAQAFGRVGGWLGDRLTDAMMYVIEGDLTALFPPGLARWTARGEGRIPTVDRDGELVRSLREGRVELHGAAEAWEGGGPAAVRVRFRGEAEWRTFAMVVACTGYEASTWRQPCLQGADVRARAHFVGFGAAPRDLLPLQGIGREASRAARIIAEKLYAADLSEARAGACQGGAAGTEPDTEPSPLAAAEKDKIA